MSDVSPSGPPLPRCPTCKQPVVWQDNRDRPFCSLTCRLVDLGVWLDEGYRISEAESARQDSLGGPE